MAETYLDDLKTARSNVVFSNYLCQPELGSDDVRNGSMASSWGDRTV